MDPSIPTFAAVEAFSLSARRATVEDLPALQALWLEAGQPAEELEKFVSEFQVVTAEDGSLLGATGLLVEGTNGLLHTETIARRAADQEDELRATLWRRVQIVARNLGVHRLWTNEEAAYWQTEFHPAPAELVKETRAEFLGNDPSAVWRVRELVDPEKAKQLVNEQMAIWAATRAQEREDFDRKRRIFMIVAVVLVFIVLGISGRLLYRVLNAPPEVQKQLFRRR